MRRLIYRRHAEAGVSCLIYGSGDRPLQLNWQKMAEKQG